MILKLITKNQKYTREDKYSHKAFLEFINEEITPYLMKIENKIMSVTSDKDLSPCLKTHVWMMKSNIAGYINTIAFLKNFSEKDPTVLVEFVNLILTQIRLDSRILGGE